ncbi:MAG: class I SAM-dependent methyltransferase [Alphaproteobacteria bacterium]|nr:class I SAM-dependent methyltransferase [Alphaproteobacteria bacterium]
MIEFGCGDGRQLRLAAYPSYLGLDVSPTAVQLCRRMSKGDKAKSFEELSRYGGETADLALSLDTIYHLVEDRVYHDYIARLMSAATRFVAIYSTNIDLIDEAGARHVRHRRFAAWIDRHASNWRLKANIPTDTRTGTPSKGARFRTSTSGSAGTERARPGRGSQLGDQVLFLSQPAVWRCSR